MITQALGGTYTVATEAGLARIPEKEADALGIEKKESAPSADIAPGDLEGAVWNQLKMVYDPEIPVNIVRPRPRLRLQRPRGGRHHLRRRENDPHRPRLRDGPHHRRRRPQQDPRPRGHR